MTRGHLRTRPARPPPYSTKRPTTRTPRRRASSSELLNSAWQSSAASAASATRRPLAAPPPSSPSGRGRRSPKWRGGPAGARLRQMRRRRWIRTRCSQRRRDAPLGVRVHHQPVGRFALVVPGYLQQVVQVVDNCRKWKVSGHAVFTHASPLDCPKRISTGQSYHASHWAGAAPYQRPARTSLVGRMGASDIGS